MQNPNNGNGTDNESRRQAEPQRRPSAAVINLPTTNSEANKPEANSSEKPVAGDAVGSTAVAGTRQFTTGGRDRTAKLAIAVLGLLFVGVIMLILLSDKGKQKTKKNEASLGSPKQEQQAEQGATAKTSLVPGSAMQPVVNDKNTASAVSARDIEATRKSRNGGEPSSADAAGGGSSTAGSGPRKTLAHIPQFQQQQSTQSSDNWTPEPYSGSSIRNEVKGNKDAENPLARPSMVFIASRENAGSSGTLRESDAASTLTLPIGSRLSARLASVVTSAVEQPVIAIIEYNYQRNGEIIVPAGSKAVGRMSQADRSGYVQLHFNHLEMPDGTNTSIDALATDTNLGPLKGKVTGTNTGKNIAVRAASGVGQVAAMAVGQNSSSVSSSISESDLLRAQVANNVGRAGDEQIMQLSMQSHPIVTIAAGTKIYVVFEKSSVSNSQRTTVSGNSQIQPGQRYGNNSVTSASATASADADNSTPQ